MAENPLTKLRLIAYHAESMGRHVPEGRNWFLAEACARHVAVTTDTEASIPDIITAGDKVTKHAELPFSANRNATRVEIGEEAYTYLLMIALGLLNKHVGDTHSKGKMVDSFEAYRAGGDLPPGIAQLMNQLFEDSKAIQELILTKVETFSDEPAVSARKILNMRKGKDNPILIVGDHSPLTARVFKNTFKALGRHCSKIYITDPDPESLNTTYNQLMREQVKSQFPIDIEKIPPGELTPDALKKIRHIFVCSAMGSHPQFEKMLVDTWQAHASPQTELVHLREADMPDATWETAKNTPGFIGKELIDGREKQIAHMNKEVFDQAYNACRNCAHTRSLGDGKKRPVRMFLTLPPEQYAKQTSSQMAPKPPATD